MNSIDITFDLETTALCPTAAVLSIGAVVWNRADEKTPFVDDDVRISTFYEHVDLRSCFVDGFTFEQSTADWWAKQSDEAKAEVLAQNQYDMPLLPLKHVIENFFAWIEDVKQILDAKTVNLWSQGSDFDIAILKNICKVYELELPVHFHNFRDHRTFFLEGARVICDVAETEFKEKDAYKLVDEYKGEGVSHCPVFDCRKSIYSTWQMTKYLKCLNL